jgi:hypothetical protein
MLAMFLRHRSRFRIRNCPVRYGAPDFQYPGEIVYEPSPRVDAKFCLDLVGSY